MILPENISLSTLVLNEIGLEITNDGFIIDQESREKLMLGNRYFNTTYYARSDIVTFNPNNSKQMAVLFAYFCKKLMYESNVYIGVIYAKKDMYGRYVLAVKANGTTEYVSKFYNIEALRYLDLICQLNGGTDVDLSRYDSDT